MTLQDQRTRFFSSDKKSALCFLNITSRSCTASGCLLCMASSTTFCNSLNGVHTVAAGREKRKHVNYGHSNQHILTLNLPNKLSSAKLLVCFNFQSASMLLKFGENVFSVSNSFLLDETPSYSVSHPDASCLHMAL